MMFGLAGVAATVIVTFAKSSRRERRRRFIIERCRHDRAIAVSWKLALELLLLLPRSACGRSAGVPGASSRHFVATTMMVVPSIEALAAAVLMVPPPRLLGELK